VLNNPQIPGNRQIPGKREKLGRIIMGKQKKKLKQFSTPQAKALGASRISGAKVAAVSKAPTPATNANKLCQKHFDAAFHNLRERSTGGFGKKQLKKALVLAPSIMPTTITSITAKPTMIEALLQGEATTNTDKNTNDNIRERKLVQKPTNIYSVLDDELEKPMFTLAPSILPTSITDTKFRVKL
jgi:hypothetical protein